MLKAYKTEIFPTSEQKKIIHKTIGVCRFIYNFYLAYSKKIHEKEEKYTAEKTFEEIRKSEKITK